LGAPSDGFTPRGVLASRWRERRQAN
jgi:hypothetical protein